MRDSLQVAATERLAEKISKWLAAPDPSINLVTARDKRQEDTGNWLLESPIFLDWKLAACSLLWLHGKAGSGKTVLSSTAIYSLLETPPIRSNVLYYYFDFQDREKQLVRKFLNYIIVQLSCKFKHSAQIAEALYNFHSRGSTTPTMQEMKATIQRMLEMTPTIYLLVDALDECRDREGLLDFLVGLRSWNQANLRVFVTSRRETDIEDSLGTVATHKIPLEESVVDGDILSYVEHQLQHDAKLSKWSQDLRMEIRTALLEGANGMFRWVVCQLDAVRKCMKPGQLRRTLKSLPATLDDTYARILENIEEDYVEDVRRVLSCLICSFYPVAIEELAETIAIVPQGETHYDVENRLLEPSNILTICSGLVTTTRSRRTTLMGDRQIPIEEVRLAHFSVKEYLVSDRIALKGCSKFYMEERITHEMLAHLCIRYLIYCFQTKLCEDSDFLLEYETAFLEKAAFAPYAASFWSEHLRAAQLDGSSPLYKECFNFFTDTAFLNVLIKLRRGWFSYEQVEIMRCCGYVLVQGGNHMYDLDFKPVPPLYYASLLGLDHLVSMLLDRGEDCNCSSSEGSCLRAAVLSDRQSVVDLLLAKGADINAVVPQEEGRFGRFGRGLDFHYSKTAIHEAVDKQHEMMARTLLAAGADVNIERRPAGGEISIEDSNTPLQAAVYRANEKLVELMLGAGADPNASAGGIGTALEWASVLKHKARIMTLLLDAGANPNLISDPKGLTSPLHNTIAQNNLIGARLLVERGVDRQTISSHIVPAIVHNAILNSAKFQATVEILIQIRPDLNFELAFITAAKYGYATSMAMMLQNGTTPNAQHNNGTAAIHAAAFTPACGSEAVQVLLDGGADVNIQGGPLGSALQGAALAGKSQVVKLLLERGSLVNHASGLYGSALKIARVRLQDQKMHCPEIWTWKPAVGIQSYGAPPGYVHRDDYLKTRTGVYKSPKDATYEAKINIAHLPNADYQTIIDLLLSNGATDV